MTAAIGVNLLLIISGFRSADRNLYHSYTGSIELIQHFDLIIVFRNANSKTFHVVHTAINACGEFGIIKTGSIIKHYI